MKRKLIIALLTISLASVFVGCKNNENTQKTTSDEKSQVVLEKLNAGYDDSEGYIENHEEDNSLTLWNAFNHSYRVLADDGKELPHRDVKTVKDSEDFKFSIEYSYNTDPKSEEALSFTATAYVNYKQVEFFSGDTTKKIKKLDFKAKKDEKVNLPIVLPTEGLHGSNKVMIVIQCNDSAGRFGRSFGNGNVAYMVDLNVGHKTGYEKNDEKATYKTITYPINNDNSHFIVNQNFRVENEESRGIEWTKPVIKVKSGEEFPLAFRFGRIKEDSLIFLTLDNEQYQLDGKDYLYFEPSENMLYKKCMIKAPKKPEIGRAHV